MRSRAHARHRELIAWWEGDTKQEEEDKLLKIASGTVLLNDRVRSRLLGKHKSTLTSCSWFINNKVLIPFGKNSYDITLRLLVNTLVRLEIWFHGWSSLLLDHRGKRKWFCTHLSYIQEEFVDIYLGCGLLWTEQSVINFVNREAFIGFCVWKQVHHK